VGGGFGAFEAWAGSDLAKLAMVIVDTTVWIDYLRGVVSQQTSWFESELNRQRFGLTDLILCEILQGVPDEVMSRQVLRELSRFQIYDTGGEDLAVEAARNFRLLRRRGRTVRKTIDGLIATFCLREGFSLLHCDRDFNHFEVVLGLSVIHP
jgi:predicted nucleic acid-binding protein